MKKAAIIFGLLVSSLVFLNLTINKETPLEGQGTLKGKVIDKDSGKELPFANVEVFSGGKAVSSVVTASDGTFLFTLNAGKYDVKFNFHGYKELTKKDVEIIPEKETVLTIEMRSEVAQIENVVMDDIESTGEEVKDCAPLLNIRSSCKKHSRGTGSMGGTSTYYNCDHYAPQHNTESYDVIKENSFKDVMHDPLSTFSIDVDRASYSNVRRFLTQNQKPVKDAVRVEEMINYFDYEYPQPKNGHPFSVTLEAGKCPWNEDHALVLIGLKGEEKDIQEIPPGNLVFLIDVSGSMGSANKLPLLKQAFKILVNNLRQEDRVAIVVYAGAAGEVLPSTPGHKKAEIIASLDRLQSGGSTAGGAGIKLAYKIAKQNFIPGGNNRVILATDGDFNVGGSSDAEMVRLIEEKRKDGVFLTVLGFGMGNYKDSKMEQLSNAGNGNYAYIDNILEAKKMFGTELWGTLYTIAKDVKIQVEFNPSKVKSYRLVGYENRLLNKEDFNDDTKDAGEIGSGHTVTALYEIVLADSEEQTTVIDPLEYQTNKVKKSSDLLKVKLRYKKPEEDVSQLIEEYIKASALNTSKMSPNLMFASSVAEFGMILRESEFKGSASFEQALALAKQGKGKDAYGYRSDFIKMVETAELLYK